MVQDKKIQNFLRKGSEIVGGFAGGSIGMLAGPAGSVVGSVAGVVVTQTLLDVIEFSLSNQQEIRIAASFNIMISGIEKRLGLGQKIRDDGFFRENTRCEARELLEGVLFKCKDQFQERKIQFISKIYEKTIFDADISSVRATLILKLADDLSFYEYMIISFFGQVNLFDRDQLLKDPFNYYPDTNFDMEMISLMQSLFSLISKGLLKIDFMAQTSADIAPYYIKLSPLGEGFYAYLELKLIDSEDINKIYNSLKYKPEYGLNQNGESNAGFPGLEV